jgi:ATP-dependent DNA ligase
VAVLSAALPVGVVLDGEICAVQPDGTMVFSELLRTHRARRQRGIATTFVAFDLLAYNGLDYRPEPLEQRLDVLAQALFDAQPAVQAVLSTRDHDEALLWYEQLVDHGVEGIVAKDLRSSYRVAGAGRAWLKFRHSETQDALLVGLVGALRRPEALVVELAGGGREVSSRRPDRSPQQSPTNGASPRATWRTCGSTG